MAELFLGGLVDAYPRSARTRQPVELDTADFTTHGVIVGMTGSGKTGLGVVLIEEVLRAGLPALLIDPKGDLTNLCLTFPDARAGRLPTVDRRGPGQGGRRLARRVRGPAGDDVDGRPRRLGLRAGADRRPARRRPTSRSTRPGSRSGVPGQHRRLAAGRRRRTTPRSSATRSTATCRASSPSSASTPIRCRAASTSCSPTSSSSRGRRARRSTCRRSSGRSSSRRSASSACSSSTSSSRPPTARSWR